MRRVAAIMVSGAAVWVMVLAAACNSRQPTVTAGGTVFDISPEILASRADTNAGRADTLVDIGAVRAGEIVKYDAWLGNAGTEPLVITEVGTSCGCTSVEYERQPIAPGEKGRFSFRFDSRGMWGMQMKLIEIRTSAAPNAYKIMVRAEVENN